MLENKDIITEFKQTGYSDKHQDSFTTGYNRGYSNGYWSAMKEVEERGIRRVIKTAGCKFRQDNEDGLLACGVPTTTYHKLLKEEQLKMQMDDQII
ncbi:MAG: hypothetical protein EOP48_17375 [Sphingobacteriales bacterium]|nr:MAG: hypothetical protein EOP48_17375 [Sphingobacteriales bacterium]